MFIIRVLISTTLALFAAACADPNGVGQISHDQFGNPFDKDLSAEVLRSAFPEAGYTYATSSPNRDLRIEYYGEDGGVYFWVPDRSSPITGTWRKDGRRGFCLSNKPTATIANEEKTEITKERCFQHAQKWQIISQVQGDPFRLASGSIPYFDLTRCRLPEPMKLVPISWSCEPTGPPRSALAITHEDLDLGEKPHFWCLIAAMGEHGDMVSDANVIAEKLANTCGEAGFEFPFRDALLAVEVARAMVYPGAELSDP